MVLGLEDLGPVNIQQLSAISNGVNTFFLWPTTYNLAATVSYLCARRSRSRDFCGRFGEVLFLQSSYKQSLLRKLYFTRELCCTIQCLSFIHVVLSVAVVSKFSYSCATIFLKETAFTKSLLLMSFTSFLPIVWRCSIRCFNVSYLNLTTGPCDYNMLKSKLHYKGSAVQKQVKFSFGLIRFQIVFSARRIYGAFILNII